MKTMIKYVSAMMSCTVLMAAPVLAADPEPKRGGTLIIAQDQGPDRIEPHGPSMTFQHSLLVNGPYEALLTFDENFVIGPSLATEWEADSPTSYVFTLRQGVKFHDGSDMTMEDVIFTFERIMDESRPTDARTKLRMVKSVTALDDRRIRFDLHAPSSAFLRYIATPEVSGIVSKNFTMNNNNDLSNIANGTGAFKITDYQAGVIIRYEKHNQYWDSNLPYIDAIENRIIPDDSTRIAALRTGEIDLTYFRPDKLPLLRTLRDVTISDPIMNSVELLWINCKAPPLDKLEVRQALALSFDKMALMNMVVPGTAKPGVMVPAADTVYGYNGDGADLPHWQRDVEKAKQLLASAGFADGVSISIQYINTPAFAMNNRIAEFMQQQAAEANINLIIEPLDFATLINNLQTFEYQVITSGKAMYADPEGSLSEVNSTNARNACPDPWIDTMMDELNREGDQTRRAAMLMDVQKYLLENVYWYFLFNTPLRFEVWKPELVGYKPMPLLRRTSLREAWLDR